jgi:hypothetical protein
MNPYYSKNMKNMKMLLGTMIMLVVSGSTLLAQDQIVDETTLPMADVANESAFDNSLVVPLEPTPDSDFQSSFVSSSFNIQAVPEPSTWTLFGVGLAFLLWKHKKYASNSF